MVSRIVQIIRTSIYPNRWAFLGIGLTILPFTSFSNIIVRIFCLVLGSIFILLSIICHFPYFQDEIPLPRFDLIMKKRSEQSEIEPFYSPNLSWTDFEEEKISIREEVYEILEKIKMQNITIIDGKPSAGKTVILNSVGYLLHRGKIALFKPKVFLIELKKHAESNIVRYFDFLRETKRKIIVLIDDVHIKPFLCNSLLIDISGKKNTKLVLCLRRIKTFTDTKTEFEYLFEKRIKIEAETEIESMIEIFLNKRYGDQISEYKKMSVYIYLMEFVNDRWLLAQALMTLDINLLKKGREEIYKRYMNKITKIQIKDKIINASDVLLPIAIFSQYEIPVHKTFLKKIGIQESLLDSLIEVNEIISEDDFVILHHSKLAELVIHTHLHFSEVLKNEMLRKYDNYENLNYNLFLEYSISFPEQILDCINNLYRADELYLLNRLLSSALFLKKFVSQLAKGQVIWKLCSCLQIFRKTQIDSSIENSLESLIYLEVLKRKIYNLTNFSYLKYKFNELRWVHKKKELFETKQSTKKISFKMPSKSRKKFVVKIVLRCKLIVEEFPIQIASKLNLEKNIVNITKGIEGLSEISSIFANLFLNNVDFESISNDVDGLNDFSFIKEYFSNLSQNRKNIVHTIVPFLNMDNILSIVEQEEDLCNIISFIRTFSKWCVNETLKLIDIVAKKLNSISEIQILGNSLEEISFGNRNIAIIILDEIPLESLKGKIQTEKNLSKITKFIGQISRLNMDIAKSLLPILLARLEKEYDFNKITTSIYGMAIENSVFVREIVRNLDSKRLFDIINKESDINNLGLFIGILSRTNEELMNFILETISKRIESENNFHKISSFYINILATNVQLAFSLSETISRKIKDSHDVFQVQVFLKLVKHLNLKLFEEIINNQF